jgi:hypothetical protein
MSHNTPGAARRAVLGACCCLLLAAASTAAQSGGAIAFVEVNVLPMDAERVLTRHTVVVQGDRIIAVDPADEAALPRGTQRIEARGKYLIPGLIDAHARLPSDVHIADDHLEAELAVVVANGVTTMRHAAGSERLLEMRDRITAADLIAPELYVSSPVLASAQPFAGFAGRVVETPFDAAAAVRQFREAGYDFVSVSYATTTEVYQGIVLTARGSGMPLIGSVPAQITLQRALESGQQIEHLDGYLEALTADGPVPADGISGDGVSELDRWRMLDDVDEGRLEDIVQATVDAETWNIPLLAATRAALDLPFDGEAEGLQTQGFLSDAVRQALRGEVRPSPTSRSSPQQRQRYLELRDRVVRALDQRGARLMAGSGAAGWLLPYGAGLHAELAALVGAGLVPHAALRAATAGPSAFFRFRGGGAAEYATVDESGIRFTSAAEAVVDFGRIDVGMRADLVLLEANPLDDIGNTRRIDGVMLRGRWLSRAELDTLLDRAAETLQGASLRGS